VATLEPLLHVQEHDLALDRLRHRRATLPERAEVQAAEADLAALDRQLAELRGPLEELARAQQRFEDEAQSLADHAKAADARLYSGQVTSPRELQALQADVDQLRRHQAMVEEQAIAVMEEREPLEAEVRELEARRARRAEELATARAALASAEAAIDAEIASEQAARDASTAGIDAAVLEMYERIRAKSATRVGAARLVGQTCQGCHLTIPATEVDALRKAPPGTIAHCDNCGAILVP
jgi:predicted  nucleic acid-binding Zn-ribbon protein